MLIDHLRDVPADMDDGALLERFLAYTEEIGLTLYPAQEEALLEVVSGKNVILSTPTGSGKSLVALCACFVALARKKRAYYTAPIKALANEKFFAMVRELGADNVGLLTGDAKVNADAPIICATAEILSNLALRDGSRADVDFVVMDEFHYYADRDRGVAWQVPLLELSRATFLLMSATMGDTAPFERILTDLTGRETAVVKSTVRPVPLEWSYADIPLHETLKDLVEKGRAPVYVVNFTQRACAEEAQNMMSVDYCSKEEKRAIAEALVGARFDSPYGKEISRFIRHGIGVHHAGLLPKYRLLVEKLAQRGLLKIVSGTDTLGVGVNIPIRTVLFTKLCKFDGQKTVILPIRDFHQIAGRAGRKGFDDQGWVVAQAPEHVIENSRLEAKAGGDPKKLRKMVKKRPPDRGYVHWDKATFERLIASEAEPLESRFSVSHGMILDVLEREGGGCMAMARLVKRSHERPAQKRIIGKTAISMFKSLVDANIVVIDHDEAGTRRVRVAADLQLDFSLNHTLSLYLIEAIPVLDRESPAYALDLLSMCEAILENPEVILLRQVDKLKTEKLGELKAAGVEYEQRMEELEKIEYPKPNAELIYDTFNTFAKHHPWVGTANIRPKSIARDMHEKFLSFPEYVKEYGLERSEGLLLRYLSDVYKVLLQTVPDSYKTPETDELATYFAAMVKQIDSSLLDEWERLRDPTAEAAPKEDRVEPEGSRDITKDPRAFTVLVRNALFSAVRAIARRDFTEAVATFDGSTEWTASSLEAAFAPFFAEHAALKTDTEARSPSHLTLTVEEWAWRFKQVLTDPEDANDWFLEGVIDLESARVAGRPVMKLTRVGS